MLGNPNTPQGERNLEDTETEGRGGHWLWKGLKQKGSFQLDTMLTKQPWLVSSLITWISAEQGPAVTGESFH